MSVRPSAPSDAFLDDYRAGRLAAFYALAPTDTDGALRLTRPTPRPSLAAALRAYAGRLNAPAPVFAQLARLAKPESRVVVTGQQAGLLLGPLYTLSKAVTAINLARRLDSGARPVVPVFWVASQDHDSAEIDHAHVLDRLERLHRLSLPLPDGAPSGRIQIASEWWARLKRELGALDAPEVQRRSVLEWLERGYAGAPSVAEGFARLLTELLGPHGLVVLDPLEPELAPLFAPVLGAEVKDPLASSRAVTEAGAALQAQGFTPQLGRAEGATNLFLEAEGQRHLLRFAQGRFHGGGRDYSQEALLALLEREPSRLTPAAALRPITQDAVLPTAVTVVGPGELRYFAQLEGVYAQHGVAMPLVWPRAQVTVLEPPVRRILAKFGLTASDVAGEGDWEAHKAQLLLELHGAAGEFAATLAALAASTASLHASVRRLDPTLAGSVERAEAHIARSVGLLRRKSARALAEREDTYTRQLTRLERHLRPLGQPQERVLSPVSFFLKFGIKPVLAALLALPPEGEHEVVL